VIGYAVALGVFVLAIVILITAGVWALAALVGVN